MKDGWKSRAITKVWAYRREAGTVAAVALTGGTALAIPAGRRWAGQSWRHARTRRLLRAGLIELKVANALGHLPRIRRVEAKAFGERIHLSMRPGHWADLLDVRSAPLASALKATSVRVEKDDKRADRVTLDVVRRDVFAKAADIPWLGLTATELSMWDPIHIGTQEDGTPLWLDLHGRHILVAGLSGSGKSNFLRLIATQAAMSYCHMVLIDPNRLQFGPWKARATAFANSDPAEALAALRWVQDEMERRLELLESLPGCPEKVTREIAEEYDLPPIVVMVDELAYHTSVVGSGQQRAEFGTTLRDILARFRAAGGTVVDATQRPTGDVVPTSLSGLHPLRVAFSVQSADNSDVILGAGLAKRGYNAAEISVDTPGVGLLLAEKAKPVKFKAARIPMSAVADLSVTTVHMRPRSGSLRVVRSAA